MEKLIKRLSRIDKQLEKVRGASPLTDGWQTQRLAKKQRAWDMLAQEKREILQELEAYPYHCTACGAMEEFECVCNENEE